MTTLVLGVNDVPYTNVTPPERKKGEKIKSGHQTTGDVAEILEDHYGVMQQFFEQNEAAIIKLMEESIQGSFETLMMSGFGSPNINAAATDAIDRMFQIWLDAEKATQLSAKYPVPTGAALAGVNHRKKHPYAKDNARRPSFIDTGLYQSSFRSLVE